MQEWSEARELDWYLLENPNHKKVQDWMKALLKLYHENPCMYELDTSWEGFQWINADDAERSIYSFVRKSKDGKNNLLFVVNFTPVERPEFRVGVPQAGSYEKVLSTQDPEFSGLPAPKKKTYRSKKMEWDGRENSIGYPLAPYEVAVFRFNPPKSTKTSATQKTAGTKRAGKKDTKKTTK